MKNEPKFTYNVGMLQVLNGIVRDVRGKIAARLAAVPFLLILTESMRCTVNRKKPGIYNVLIET